ncbi:hypothetical protein B5F64_07905 [Thomasclavelia spiroformis]|nr:hypothetical protein B5F64_07905 [Thomasclavelia spiroformis]
MIKMLFYFLYSGYIILLIGLLGGRISGNVDMLKFSVVCLIVCLFDFLISYLVIFKGKLNGQEITHNQQNFKKVIKLLIIPLVIIYFVNFLT